MTSLHAKSADMAERSKSFYRRRLELIRSGAWKKIDEAKSKVIKLEFMEDEWKEDSHKKKPKLAHCENARDGFPMESNKCDCLNLLCPYREDSEPSSNTDSREEEHGTSEETGKQQVNSEEQKVSVPKKDKIDSEQNSAANNISSNDGVSECEGFSVCELELEQIMVNLAAGECGCSGNYIDIECIKKAIETFEIDRIIICPGCFYGSGGQISHYCVSAELLGLKWSEQVERAVLEEDRFRELLSIYCTQHEIFEQKSKSTQFKAGIELLIEDDNYNLGFKLCQKDQASYYRLRETPYEKSKRETAELWDSLTNW